MGHNVQRCRPINILAHDVGQSIIVLKYKLITEAKDMMWKVCHGLLALSNVQVSQVAHPLPFKQFPIATIRLPLGNHHLLIGCDASYCQHFASQINIITAHVIKKTMSQGTSNTTCKRK
ncbi:hypothetical protein GOP47_0019298 [Adiantum capillus-veneris]|uniref:Uncharacterized protein n=1 Tax=Adiantum capillus-veneris TaxID=13818 RepID=A0A9D4UG02_ADICA|nr:hypothetical protein GOP47_0019298 [Adiantum capillus-veneris]